ncbi:MAG: sugar ABC transporter substrate-binding protein [Mogibacterium sp.]|nr:sugar ABC transporter substrate-binding protein [Mogibacterium sp.]
MKKLFALLLTLVLVFSLTACGSNGGSENNGGESESTEKKVAVFNYNSMNAAANPIMEGMVDVIEEHGDEYIYAAADNTEANILQVFDELVARDDIKAIVFPNINDTLLLDSIKRAKEKGIVVATMDIRLEDDENSRLVVSQTLDDNYQGGYDCADLILTTLEEQGVTPQVIYMTYRGNNACRDRSAGYDDAMAAHPNAVLLYEADVTTVGSISDATEDLLLKYPECNAIFAVFDGGCVQVLAGCKAQGRNDILICSQDGGTDVQDFIKNGEVFCAACQPLYEMGRNTAESAYKALNGEDQEYWYNYDIPIITKENVQATIDQFSKFTYRWMG